LPSPSECYWGQRAPQSPTFTMTRIHELTMNRSSNRIPCNRDRFHRRNTNGIFDLAGDRLHRRNPPLHKRGSPCSCNWTFNNHIRYILDLRHLHRSGDRFGLPYVRVSYHLHRMSPPLHKRGSPCSCNQP